MDVEARMPKLVKSWDMVWLLTSLDGWSLKWFSYLFDKMFDM